MTGVWDGFGRFAAPMLMVSSVAAQSLIPLPSGDTPPSKPSIALQFKSTAGPSSVSYIGNAFNGQVVTHNSTERLGRFENTVTGQTLILDCKQLADLRFQSQMKTFHSPHYRDKLDAINQTGEFRIGEIAMGCPAPLWI